MSAQFGRPAFGGYFFLTDSPSDRIFPRAAGAYRCRLEVRVYSQGTAVPQPVSFSIMANGVVVAQYSRARATFNDGRDLTTIATTFAVDTTIALDTDGVISFVLPPGESMAGSVEILPV